MSNESAPAPASRWQTRPGWFAAAALFVGLAWRQDRFVSRYAVNILYWDQWDFYFPFFHHQGWWEIFTWQHGPHREGVGLLVTGLLARLSGWNSRWDSFGVSGVIIAAAVLAARLAWKCGIRNGWALAALPLIFFNLHQYESFIGAPHLSHGAMPLLLFLLTGLAWLCPEPHRRLLAIGALTFLLIFTGFGLFAGLITPLVVALEAVQALRAGDRSRAGAALVALLIAAIGWALFFRGYLFVATGDAFRLPRSRWDEYVFFAAMMLANTFGFHRPAAWPGTIPLAFGFLVIAILAGICLRHLRRLLGRGVAEEPRSAVLFSLALFVLVYCANTAIGRASDGLAQASLASRYVTLLIPAGLAIFLEIGLLPARRWGAWLGAAYAVLLVPATLFLHPDEVASIQAYSGGKRAWKEAYLATQDEAKADARSNFRVYPHSVADKLEFLERNRLNLFSPTERAKDP